MKMTKWIQLILTLIIISSLIVKCCTGKDASWLSVFVGWSFVLLYEIRILFNNYGLNLNSIYRKLKENIRSKK
jgi:hypothetical protein